ncbi:hypothetical protein BKA59DRAFT_471630 [Fusarium tricinctum]|uniref:Heterokaryon incompatibility domain-containing protein n=1 Tax=Fusarium tricinctum TaxID=61284 RepID=A0A8K0RZU7_9HYPO|nr:hypothetical protein BKA59DRAFT_471630 [Fusarium tricinctum]
MTEKQTIRSTPASEDEPDVISSLLEIQKCRIPQQKMRWIVENLQCLGSQQSKKRKFTRDEDAKHETPRWFRENINGFKQTNFVALSYTWDPSDHERQDPEEKKHLIETRHGQDAWPSSVRNSILERITRYMQCHNVPLLWIDRHSIPQKRKCKAVCPHEDCKEKRHALDAMDWIYSRSDHPVALLGRPIQSEEEMETLSDILRGAMVKYQGGWALANKAEYSQARKMLDLLYEITKDKWWRRAWTFQENYRAGINMTLLFHHAPDLEKAKRSIRTGNKPTFGVVPGELSVQSVKFSESATKFCLAFRRHHFVTSEDEEKITYILNTAGRYKLLLPASSSMSGNIVSDVLKRGVSVPWDCLSIIANCCQYATRLDTTSLQQDGKDGPSLEISILALRLLNGEILKNDEPSERLGSIVEKINDLFFDDFQAPEGVKNRLTFNKSCRFVDVKFTETGITTRGHLWKLGETLRAPRSSPRLSQSTQKDDEQLTDYQRTRLRQLAELVRAKKGRKHAEIYNDMGDFLEEDASVVDEDESFSLRYRRLMAREVVRVMDADQPLSLGYLCDSSGAPTTARAIFVRNQKFDKADSFLDHEDDGPEHVFTSLWREQEQDEEYLANDLDHHVSLGVRLSDGGYPGPMRLYSKEWVLGLCFFTGAAPYDVVFPWPKLLTE